MNNDKRKILASEKTSQIKALHSSHGELSVERVDLAIKTLELEMADTGVFIIEHVEKADSKFNDKSVIYFNNLLEQLSILRRIKNISVICTKANSLKDHIK